MKISQDPFSLIFFFIFFMEFFLYKESLGGLWSEQTKLVQVSFTTVMHRRAPGVIPSLKSASRRKKGPMHQEEKKGQSSR